MGVYWRKSVDATAGIEGICNFICKRKRTRKRMMRKYQVSICAVVVEKVKVSKMSQDVEGLQICGFCGEDIIFIRVTSAKDKAPGGCCCFLLGTFDEDLPNTSD